MSTHLFTVLAAILPVAVQFILFLRWLHRRMRADEIARAFVRDLAVEKAAQCARLQAACPRGL